jgi:hypothetical protein
MPRTPSPLRPILLSLLAFVGACAGDRYEGDEPGECRDGADNDRDGLFDCGDDACSSSPDCAVAEGDESGECRDGADNDLDGLFDCDDPGCSASPDCDGDIDPNDDTGDGGGDDTGDGGDDTGGGGDDTGDPKDTGGGGDTSAPEGVGDIVSATVRLRMEFDVIDGVFGLVDCEDIYEGSANRIAVSGSTVQMSGTWVQSSTTCGGNYDSLVWHTSAGTGYHTFIFKDGVKFLDKWVVHRDEGDYVANTLKNKWPMWDMASPISASDLTTEYTESFTDSDGTTVNMTLNVAFGG